ncbi:MAG TPA: 5'/3'-nucleotidase SurE [Candidatus Binatia bacterium]
MKTRKPMLATALAAAFALVTMLAAPPQAGAAPFRIVVGNDDGYSAEGIAELVRALTRNRSLEVYVFAPATNQSGTGDRTTLGPLRIDPNVTTAFGYPATAVAGFPADGVLFGILQGLDQRPDLVISGINEGQNIAELVNISGTVGAALWAARNGVPAFAVSQGLAAEMHYEEAADYTARLVARYRSSPSFRKLMRISKDRARVLNINFPTCVTGKLRGVRAVAVGRAQQIVGYEQGSSPNTWDPIVVTMPAGSTNCDSTLRHPTTDIEAMNNGFASVTPLNPDLTSDETIKPLVRLVEE